MCKSKTITTDTIAVCQLANSWFGHAISMHSDN